MSKDKEVRRVLIGIPSYDSTLHCSTVDSLIQTLAAAPSYNVDLKHLFITSDSLIERARNTIFFNAFVNNFDDLVMIDADVGGWTSEHFFRLINLPKDLVGYAYRKKNDFEELYAFKALEQNNLEGIEDYFLTPDSNSLLEVRGLPCGFLRMSRNCMKTLWDNEKGIFRDSEKEMRRIFECHVNSQGHFISEDIFCCQKYRELGGKVFLDCSFTPNHSGLKVYEGNIAAWLADWRIKIDQNNKLQKQKVDLLKPYFQGNSIKDNNIKDQEDLFKVL